MSFWSIRGSKGFDDLRCSSLMRGERENAGETKSADEMTKDAMMSFNAFCNRNREKCEDESRRYF